MKRSFARTVAVGAAAVLLGTVSLFGQEKAAKDSRIEPAHERTERLAEWESLDYGMFIHYGMSTFDGKEINDGATPSTVYAPTDLDVRQWVHTAREAGMKYAVLTAKHVAGHCLWDSEGYDYDVATSSDKTDVVAAFMKACKAEGIKPGLYYCILDGHNEGGVKWQASVGPEYFKLIKHHLTELHTKYTDPGIYEQWIDITAKMSPEQRWELYRLIKKLNPDCTIIMNQGFRDGVTIPMGSWPTDLANGERTLPPESGHDPWKEIDGKKYYIPMEVCDTIGENWFWEENDAPRPAWALYTLYKQATERGANLLLDVPPDKSGQIPEEHVKALLQLKKIIDNPEQYAPPESISQGKPAKASNVYKGMTEQYGAAKAVDGDVNTRWASDESVTTATLEVDLGEPMTFGRVWMAQAYNRIRSFAVEYKDGDAWKECAKGSGLSTDYFLKFEPVTARRVRLHVLNSAGGPTIKEIQLYPPEKE